MSASSLRRSPLRRAAAVLLFAAAAWLAVALTALPRRGRPVSGSDPSLASRTVRGAFHVHTTRSDGALDKSAVAASARRAGLQFVIVTDHGDGTRPADPPEYIDGVLCLDGVEISTDQGHYVAIGAAPSPYPLGGASDAVVEDVRRLGGFGVAAHPGSARQELAWRDWTVPVDAVEWLNADSEWRDETRLALARAAAAYPIRSSGALAMLLDRPSDTLARWDRSARTRAVRGLAGHDAHGGIGGRLEGNSGGRRLRIPSYDASFGTFANYVEIERPFSGAAEQDGQALLDALRQGRVFTVIDAITSGATLSFSARSHDAEASHGGILPGGGTATFTARAAVPENATIVAFRDGDDIARRAGGQLEFSSGALGVYRVEVHVPGAPGEPPVPWLVSNPIFRLVPDPPVAEDPPVIAVPLASRQWRLENDPSSVGGVQPGAVDGEVRFAYRLGSGQPASQFAALAVDLPAALPPFERVTFTARSDRPSRISVQLRFASDRGARWGRSVYLSPDPAPIEVPVGRMRPAEGGAALPDVRRATSLLLVVDLTNARPGTTGTVTLSDLALTR